MFGKKQPHSYDTARSSLAPASRLGRRFVVEMFTVSRVGSCVNTPRVTLLKILTCYERRVVNSRCQTSQITPKRIQKLPEGAEKVLKVKRRDLAPQTFLQRFLAPKPMPERNTAAWYREMLLICTVFGITGSSTMMLVRFLILVVKL